MTEKEIVGSLVKRLGGSGAVATHLGAKPNSVRQWPLRGHIPWRWRSAIRQMAAEKGEILSADEQRSLSLIPVEASAA